jgi:hypothetical protein
MSMKIVKIYGGLGNQMFQYAFAMSLAAKGLDDVFIDSSALVGDRVHHGYELDRVFGVALSEARPLDVDRLSSRPSGIAGRIRRKYFTKPSHFIDREFRYQGELLSRTGDTYYEGYWQSEKYFKDIEKEIRAGFAFKAPLAEKNLSLLADIPRPAVSVHVRRGDYLKYDNLNICSPAYYEKALAALTASSGIASLLVFSEDVEYCKASLRLGALSAVFVDWNKGSDSWQDMAMMSLCDHHIIANSSFSWWGAWLDPKPTKRVVAPSVWNRQTAAGGDRYYRFSFGDVLPEAWETVDLGESGGAS